jgi:hypothetical protein
MASSAISGAVTPAAKRWSHTAPANLAIRRLTSATLSYRHRCHNLTAANLFAVPDPLQSVARDGERVMTERTEAKTPRDRLLEAVRKELAQFERRENEFRKQDREERAAELRLPLIKIH